MFVLNWVLWGLVAPTVIAAAVLVIARWIDGPDVPWGVALALGSGYVAGHLAHPWPTAFPPVEVSDRLILTALAATLYGFFEGRWPAPAWSRWQNRLMLTGFLLWQIAGPAFQETWSTGRGLAVLAGLGALILVDWVLMEGLAARITGAAMILPLLALAGGSSLVILLSGSVTLGQLGMGLTVSIAAALLVSAWYRGLSLARGGIPVIVLVLAGLVIDAAYYASLTPACASLIAVAPLAAWTARLRPIRRLKPWQSTTIATLATLIPIGIAVGLALAAESSPEGY